MKFTYMTVENNGLAGVTFKRDLIKAYTQVFFHESECMGIPASAYDPVAIKKNIEKLMANVPFFIVARDVTKIIGVLANRPDDMREIHTLFVEEEYRSKGVGQALVEHFQRCLPRKELFVECVKENYKAIRFYERLGFEFTEEPRYESNLKGIRPVKF